MIKRSNLQLESRSEQVKNDLRRQIINGEFKIGELLPTTAELATHYQVSRETVNHAMSLLVAEKLIVRKRGRGTRVVKSKPQEMVSKGYQDIGLYLPMLKHENDNLDPEESPVWFRIFTGALAAANSAKYRLVPICSGEHALTETIAAHCLQGIMLPGQTWIIEEFVESELFHKIPHFFLGMGADFKMLNHLEELGTVGVKSIIEHLIGLGHQRIAGFSSGVSNLIHERVFRAHREALIENGSYSPQWLYRLEENSSPEDYEQAVSQLLNLSERPTVIVVYRERFVQGVMDALQKHNIRIPEDMSLVMVENDAGHEHIYNGLKVDCLQLPTKEELGRYGCQLMIEQLEGRSSVPINAELSWTEVAGETLREMK